MPKVTAEKKNEANWSQSDVHRVAIDYNTADYARVSAAAEAAGFAVAAFCRRAIENQIARDAHDTEPTPEELAAEEKRWADMTPEEMEAEESKLTPNAETIAAIEEIENGGGGVFSGSTADFIKMMLED